jgi:uncharacterized repeat protein (TIGR02543 family)
MAKMRAGSSRLGRTATVTMVALILTTVFSFQAGPASAQVQGATLTVSAAGSGKISGPGIDCGNGGSDCSETYPIGSERICEPDPDTGRPVCTNQPVYQEVSLGVSMNAGFQFQGWAGDCTGTQDTCTLTMDADKSVTAGFADVQAPTAGANNASVAVDEGQTATNTGTYSDNGGGNVTITASSGSVTRTGTNGGTWSWSQATNDGPSQGGTVTISFRDAFGNASATSFPLTVRNVSPTATFGTPQTSHAGKTFVISLNDPSDPSGTDTNAGFSYAFDCGGGFISGRNGNCQAGAAGTSMTVRAQIRDKDGGVTEYARNVQINAAPQSHPNGRIAFVSFRDASNQEVYSMGADGAGLRRLTSTSTQEANVDYSPDGKKITFDAGGDIHVMNANGTGRTNLTNGVDPPNALPTFSPDGQKIAFQRGSGNEGEIFVINADGTGRVRLTNNTFADADPDFSPNGSQIAFHSNRDGNDEVYVMNADGTGQTRITNNAAADLDPSYSPDGSRIAFQTNRTGNDEIFATSAAGFGQSNLTNNPGRDVQPAYAPNSFEISFSSDRSNNFEIYKMNDFSGSATTNLTNNPALDADPAWGGTSDFTPPPAFIASGPSGFVNATSATFELRSGALEASPAFECSLDGGAFEPCASPRTYNNLGAGEHTFRVQAIDTSGNASPNPASRTWTIDTSAPTTTGSAPPEGALNVLESANPTVTFSETINAGTLNNATFTLTKQGASSPVAAAYRYDAATNTATLDPEADLDSLATYTALVKGGAAGVKDRAGNPLAADRTWTFRTGDTRSPGVTLTSPADGATVGGQVPLRANATDNGVVDRVEFIVNGSVVHSDVTAPYEFTWSSAGVTNGDAVRISARAIDTASNQATSAAHTVTVDANAPTVLRTTPAGTRVAPTANVTATFSEAMDRTSLTRTTVKLVRRGTTAAIPASVTVSQDGKSVTLNPTRPLRRGTRYTATVTTGAKDLAGNPLAANKAWSFTVRR